MRRIPSVLHFLSWSTGTQLRRKEERYWNRNGAGREWLAVLKCVNIWNDINRRSSQQITSSQAWICNPKMLGFRLSWLQKESYIVKLKHLYTWTINYCTYRFRASTPCVLGIWRHLPFQSCQRWLLWCIRVCAVCNIVHDLFNENKLFCLHIVSTSSMCVFDIFNTGETSCEFSFSLYVSPMRNVSGT